MHRATFGEPLSRRHLLLRCANGFGAGALSARLADDARSVGPPAARGPGPLAPRPPHHKAKARSVIFLYMDGGPSQVDTFDPKPRLDREHGQPIKMKAPPTQFIPHDVAPKIMASPWKFDRHGQSGTAVSGLFPHVAGCVDDLAVVRSMVANFTEHANANLFLHTGANTQGKPSVGSWVTYGLGSECDNLPGYVVLKGGNIPAGGPDNFHSGYLPAVYQGSIFRDPEKPLANLERPEGSSELQRGKLDLLNQLDQSVLARLGPADQVEAAIANYELAFRMQAAVPELLDTRGETAATHKMYGTDDETTQTFGRSCLLARRLIERGVRFVEVTPPAVA